MWREGLGTNVPGYLRVWVCGRAGVRVCGGRTRDNRTGAGCACVRVRVCVCVCVCVSVCVGVEARNKCTGPGERGTSVCVHVCVSVRACGRESGGWHTRAGGDGVRW